MKKHTNGSGTASKIVLNGRTYHEYRISLEDGKRKKFTAKTAREAREKAGAYLESIQAGAVNVGEGAKLTIRTLTPDTSTSSISTPDRPWAA